MHGHTIIKKMIKVSCVINVVYLLHVSATVVTIVRELLYQRCTAELRFCELMGTKEVRLIKHA
jgi:hypothetical protein